MILMVEIVLVRMDSGEQLEWVRRPMQERSQRTLERILSAAETLILEVGFEGATVAEIVRRADSSVGAFYTRFKDKDALLRCLIDRFFHATMRAPRNARMYELPLGSGTLALSTTGTGS